MFKFVYLFHKLIFLVENITSQVSFSHQDLKIKKNYVCNLILKKKYDADS